MRSKKLLFAKEAKLKILEGIDQMVDIFAPTFGPSEKTIAIYEPLEKIKFQKKDSLIHSLLQVKDPFIDIGVNIARQAALEVKRQTGDGAITTLLLIQALVEEGINSPISPILLVEELEKELNSILKKIDEKTIPISTNKEIKDVLLTHSSDKQLVSIISEAFEKVGKTGYIIIEEGDSCENILQLYNGIPVFSGFAHPGFITDNKKMIAGSLNNIGSTIGSKPG